MNPKGRPEGEYRRALREGSSMHATGETAGRAKARRARRRVFARRPTAQCWHAEGVQEAEA